MASKFCGHFKISDEATSVLDQIFKFFFFIHYIIILHFSNYSQILFCLIFEK